MRVCIHLQVAAIQAEVSRRLRECERDLAKAEPALEAATNALQTLNKVVFKNVKRRGKKNLYNLCKCTLYTLPFDYQV